MHDAVTCGHGVGTWAHLFQQALGGCMQVRVGVAKAVDERAQEARREH